MSLRGLRTYLLCSSIEHLWISLLMVGLNISEMLSSGSGKCLLDLQSSSDGHTADPWFPQANMTPATNIDLCI